MCSIHNPTYRRKPPSRRKPSSRRKLSSCRKLSFRRPGLDPVQGFLSHRTTPRYPYASQNKPCPGSSPGRRGRGTPRESGPNVRCESPASMWCATLPQRHPPSRRSARQPLSRDKPRDPGHHRAIRHPANPRIPNAQNPLPLSVCDHLLPIWQENFVPLLFLWNEAGTKALLTVLVDYL